VRFFVGGVPTLESQPVDEIELGVDDSYDGLPAKVREICRWALLYGYDELVKVDDDVYLVPGRLPDYAAYDYVGNFRMHNGLSPYDYASGFCYRLGRRAIELVAGAELTRDTMEDRWVGHVMGSARNIRSLDEKRFACTFPTGVEEPKMLWGSPLGKTVIAVAQYPWGHFDGLDYWYRRAFINAHGV
jgi:hypothetical protein